ncbi:two-component system chemotaxis response regulator CheB [Metabacillus crassostreae]|uniref:protein-glutamate methylesterase/protein-glutamine glutaminase n=1 Tax=Metabacillus crassostreae TaxID=929098 RepID=UPI00195C7063|nr:chemotaxis response regulator protein-glutamate methylesterase [Metabacillus crassostreae]MBM7603303.1 two-component system chemotaxis response regulator CheB [Metabacillus crassostreae]
MVKIRVLVVDDSAFMRKLITDFLNEDENIEVVGVARNGEDALIKIKELNPDVVTLDVEMPVKNGLEALKDIMKQFPRPVIMLSSTTKEGAENTILSLQYGAFDFIAKPSGAISLDLYKVKEDLIEKVKLAKRANIPNSLQQQNSKKYPKMQQEYSKIDSKSKERPKFIDKISKNKSLVCIGTSTGGPRALQQVLPKIPADINAPIFIVQHMPPGFTLSLANRLNTVSLITVKEAVNGEVVKNGTAYIAPGGSHLKVIKSGTSLTIKIDQSDIRNGHRPSVDVMFESISEIPDYNKIAVIMTGMGADGSDGLKKLKNTGHVKAISESEQTSIVYGMPKAAVGTTFVDKVEDVQNIAAAIVDFLEN